VLLALLGRRPAGQGVVWYTGQFYALVFLTITLKLDYVSAVYVIGASLLLGTPFFIFFGWLSDKIGRLKIILAGCPDRGGDVLPAVPGPHALRQPAARGVLGQRTPITVAGQRADCKFHIFVGPVEQVLRLRPGKDFLTKQGLSFKSVSGRAGKVVTTSAPRKSKAGIKRRSPPP
jgi:hypothetical protein